MLCLPLVRTVAFPLGPGTGLSQATSGAQRKGFCALLYEPP